VTIGPGEDVLVIVAPGSVPSAEEEDGAQPTRFWKAHKADVTRAYERRVIDAAQRGDGEARDALIEEFRPMIASMARRYDGCPAVNRAELMQEGVVGVLRALKRFDPALTTPFWAYASWWVRQAMQRLVAELGQPVVLSDRALRHLAQVKDARRDLQQGGSSEPSTDRLASATGLKREHVDHLIAVERAPRALDEPGPGSENQGATLGELLPDRRAEDAYDDVDGRLDAPEWRRLLGRLDARERLILRARYGFDGHEATLREIADDLDLSAERVRQIEQHALDELTPT
jgi:RNA polymerase sigma factor (sigma-70 family)